MQKAKDPTNNTQQYFDEVFQICVKHKRFDDAIDNLAKALKEGIKVEYTSEYIIEIISHLKRSPRIFEIGVLMIKTDIGLAMVREMFPKPVIDILFNHQSKLFEILCHDPQNKATHGQKLSSHRTSTSDKRNGHSTKAMIHTPGWAGKSWKLVLDPDGKYFKIIVGNDSFEKYISSQIGWELMAHRWKPNDQRDQVSTYAITHKTGYNCNKWQIVPCDDGNSFKILLGQDLNKFYQVDQEGWFLSHHQLKGKDDRDKYSTYVYIHQTDDQGSKWNIQLMKEDNE